MISVSFRDFFPKNKTGCPRRWPLWAARPT